MKMEQSLVWVSGACACKIPLWAFDTVSGNIKYGQSRMVTDQTPADYNSVFPAGVNVAATWDRGAALARGRAMGNEHRLKGTDVQLGPVAGGLGRSPEGGRNWEGFR